VPEFYEVVLQADPTAQAEASDELLRQATDLAGELREQGRWEATFTAEQINGWLAVDLVENHPDQLPNSLSDPRVAIKPDRLMLACRFHEGRIDSVLSLALDVYLAERGVVAVRIRQARAGSLPLPLERVLEEINKAAGRSTARIRWRQADGDPVAMISLPEPRGPDARAVRIDTLRLEDGAIHVSGTTERR